MGVRKSLDVVTPPKTNMDTSNGGVEKVLPYKYGHFSYLCYISGGYMSVVPSSKKRGHDNFSGGFSFQFFPDFWMAICEGFLDSKCAKNSMQLMGSLPRVPLIFL